MRLIQVLGMFGLIWGLVACSETSQDLTLAENALMEETSINAENWWDNLPRAAWSQFPQVTIQQSENWFQVYEVSDGVFGIYEDGQSEEVISYLIVGDDSALLFDTGIGVGDISNVVTQLTELPVAVLNSHTHYDHVGGNHFFSKIYGVDSAYSLQNSKGRDNADIARFLGEGWVWKPLPAGTTVSNYESKPFVISDFVEDGEIIDLGGKQLEVILVPGHAPDALVLLDRDSRLLFMGDTFYPSSLYAHLSDSNFSDYVNSTEKLVQYQSVVDYILPAHNEPLMPSYYLRAMRDAFAAIQAPNAPYVLSDGVREYDFEGFSIMVNEPPPWE